MSTVIGKIKEARFGFGGYQDAEIGLTVVLGSDKDCWSTVDFKGSWHIKRMDGAKWEECEREAWLGRSVMFLADVLKDANVRGVEELVGVPVEVTFDVNQRLQSWRVLTEVL